jgi:hypothetical protein
MSRKAINQIFTYEVLDTPRLTALGIITGVVVLLKIFTF